MGILLDIPNDQVKHIHTTSKKRISDHWKLLLRVCRNDPASDYFIFVYASYKVAKFIKLGANQPNLYDSDEKLMYLANNCPDNVKVLALQDNCNCGDLTGTNLSEAGTLIESGKRNNLF